MQAFKHIDNIVTTGGTAGPVFTMSLGGPPVKHFDMIPVIEHWRTPKRIFNLLVHKH